MGRGFRKPKEKTYVIKEECLLPGGGSAPKHPFFDVEDYLKSNDTSPRYNASEYFSKKPPFAVLTNKDTFTETTKSHLNFENKRLKIYLIDDLNKRKQYNSDTFFLRTFNPKKNDYSNYIVTDVTKKIKLTTKPDKNNIYHKWTVRTGNIEDLISTGCLTPKSGSNLNFNYDVIIESYGLTKDNVANRALTQYYDNFGKSKFEFVDKTANTVDKNWKYSQMLKLPDPRFCIQTSSS
jgi:hypothetical protein